MLEIAEQNVTQRQRHYEEAQKKFRLGTATDYDVLSAKVALKNAMPDVITYKNNLITAKDRLKYILGTDDDIDAEGSLGFNPEKTGDYDTLIKTAMEMRPEIRDKKLMVDVYREMVKIDSSDDKPRIDFKGSFDRTKMDGDTVYTGNTWNLGLTLSYNIFDGLKTSGKHTQAVSTLRRSRLQELQQVDSVSLELRQAISRLKEAEETIYAAEGTREEAARLLDMAEKGYSFGVKTKLEVDDAEFNLRSADVRLAQAYRNYKVSHVDLLWSAGILGEKTF
jgi:HAE1 family hydrophobic/amphiphilic exporter-1